MTPRQLGGAILAGLVSWACIFGLWFSLSPYLLQPLRPVVLLVWHYEPPQ